MGAAGADRTPEPGSPDVEGDFHPLVAGECAIDGVGAGWGFELDPTRGAVERIVTWQAPEPEGTPEQIARDYLVSLWGELTANLPLARQATVTEGGRELRLRRFRLSRTLEEQALRDAGFDPDEPEIRKLLACLTALSSAHALLDLHDRQGLDVEAAVEAVLWGCATLCEAVGLSPELLFNLPEPPPPVESEPGT